MLIDIDDFVASLDGESKQALDKILAPEWESLGFLGSPTLKMNHSAKPIIRRPTSCFLAARWWRKSDLILGTALTQHTRCVIFRRQATDLRDISERLLTIIKGREGWNGVEKILRRDDIIIEFGHLEKPGSEESWRGRLTIS